VYIKYTNSVTGDEWIMYIFLYIHLTTGTCATFNSLDYSFYLNIWHVHSPVYLQQW